MLKANFNRAFFLTLFLTLVFLAGCSSPEEKKSARIDEAMELSQTGDYASAIEILEALAAQYPNDLEILTALGRVYSTEGDHTMAAFYLEQSHLQATDNIELLFQAYRGLRAADQPAGHLLEKLAEQAPDAMNAELWARLGQTRQAANQFQPALDAYLKSTGSGPVDPQTSAAIGELYMKLGNTAQAESWLERAADNDDPNALTALFGLLEIKLRQKDWPGAEATLAQLDRRFPGAVEASRWDQARQELERWREAQDAMQARLARAEAEKEAAEAARVEAEAEETGTEASSETADTEGGSDSEQADTDLSGSESSAGEGKAQVITDLEAAEAMANAPAIEMPDSESSTSGRSVRFDPNIAVEPADPDISFQVDFDQAEQGATTTYAVETTEPAETPGPVETPELPSRITLNQTTNLGGALGTGITPEFAPNRPEAGPRTIEELLADAELAERDRDFKSAIRKYWAAISISNQRADVWNLLSRAYLVDGQINNAETSALEAVRLAPREVAYTLDYLRVAQRSKNADAFLSDLETAYDRFPASPEITLSLARAHERISQQTETARRLYLRFIDIAPSHPLVPEARAAVARL
ncbi:MAG: tetratricopeptide repeat protein [Verrucomicrobia bacterium]|jgi:tetratricopeptide (TPR) repeat protein|nr:tetratricopeptide repeat protein [Verrucomicrobiota bacterium]